MLAEVNNNADIQVNPVNEDPCRVARFLTGVHLLQACISYRRASLTGVHLCFSKFFSFVLKLHLYRAVRTGLLPKLLVGAICLPNILAPKYLAES
jgi:hypothetical protein